jgi:transcriptional regulator GlxA family with amidase domain
MKIAYILFDGITWLDFIGVYEPISKLKSNHCLPDLEWDTCSFTGTAADRYGLSVLPGKTNEPLDKYDVIIVPGGIGTRELQYDVPFLEWIRTARNAEWKISICTGSLILGAAGFLKGRKATTNFQEYEALRPYCAQVLPNRIVEDGDVITAGAVSSSIDLGLYLCHKWAGAVASDTIRRKMDYHG